MGISSSFHSQRLLPFQFCSQWDLYYDSDSKSFWHVPVFQHFLEPQVWVAFQALPVQVSLFVQLVRKQAINAVSKLVCEMHLKEEKLQEPLMVSVFEDDSDAVTREMRTEQNFDRSCGHEELCIFLQKSVSELTSFKIFLFAEKAFRLILLTVSAFLQ